MRSVFVCLFGDADATSSEFGCLLTGSFAVSVPVLSQGLLFETDLGLYREFRVLHCVVYFPPPGTVCLASWRVSPWLGRKGLRSSRDVALSFRSACRTGSNAARGGYYWVCREEREKV